MKSTSYSRQILMELEFSEQIFDQTHKTVFMKIRPALLFERSYIE
jgi:hypothetical protein